MSTTSEKQWVITYEELTPMGLSSSKIRTEKVYAKTKRGAESYYKKSLYRSSDSAYATFLMDIQELNK